MVFPTRPAARHALPALGEARARRRVRASFPARVVRPSAVDVVRVLGVEVVFQLLRLVEVELLFVLRIRVRVSVNSSNKCAKIRRKFVRKRKDEAENIP